jgi:GT2 family glycosyltransferase
MPSAADHSLPVQQPKVPNRMATAQPSPNVSIVIATYARPQRIKRCLAAVRRNVSIPREVVVVGSGDSATDAWLARQADVRFIHEARREGATKAYNKGFRAARGNYVMWLNDDSYPLSGAVEAAVEMIERPDLADVGMVAFYHNEDRRWNRLDEIEHDSEAFAIYNVRGMPYANFGLLRRSLLERLGYLDERYYFCAWDPDLALKVQREAGLKVVGCPRALIRHEEVMDGRKIADLAVAHEDNARLFAKWNLPEKFSYPDPAPAYRALRARLALGSKTAAAGVAPASQLP